MELTEAELAFVEVLGRVCKAVIPLLGDVSLANFNWYGEPDMDNETTSITDAKITNNERLSELGINRTDIAEAMALVGAMNNEGVARLFRLAKLAQLA